MIPFEYALFVLLIIIAVIYDARKVKQHRDRIKERVAREFSQEIELSVDELQSRLGESELMYENLEETHWVHVGLLVGTATYFYWHNWYISIAMGVSLIFIGYKFLCFRPFTTGALMQMIKSSPVINMYTSLSITHLLPDTKAKATASWHQCQCYCQTRQNLVLNTYATRLAQPS